MKRNMKKLASALAILMFFGSFSFAEVVDNALARRFQEIFPELSQGYIDLNNNGKLDRLEDMDELVPDSRVKDEIIQVQEVLDFIRENYPFFMMDDLFAVRDALENAKGTIPELIGLSYKRTIDEVIRKKEELGIEGIYLSPSAKEKAYDRMAGLIATMVEAYKNETAEDERRFIEARDELFTMIEQGYPIIEDMPSEDENVLVSALIQTTINERGSNPERVKSAIKTLGKLRDPFAVPYILDLMKIEEYQVACIRALGEIGNQEAEEKLIGLLEEESNVRLREAALKSLGRIGGEESLDLLVTLLPEVKGASPKEEAAILHALSGMAVQGGSDRRISSVLTDYINSPDPEMRILAAKGLASLPNQNNINLLVTALQNEKDEEVKIELVRSMSKIGSAQIVNVLVRMLRDDGTSSKLKRVVLEELGTVAEGVRAVTTVQDFLGDSNPEVREAAKKCLLSLYDFNAKAVAGTVNRTALTASNRLLLTEAAAILAELADPDTLSGLMNLLSNPDGEVKRHATWAIYRIGVIENSRMIDNLLQMISSETEPLEVRINAVRAIGLAKSPTDAIVQTLLTTAKMRGEKYTVLRYFAIEAIGKLRIADRETIETMAKIALREDDKLLKKAVLRALRSAGTEVEGIADTLASIFRREDDPEILTLVIEALGDLKQENTPELAESFLEENRLPESKRRVMYALAACGTERAVNLIITHAADPDVSELAVELLQGMGSRTMKPLVEKRLRTESDPGVVTVLEDLQMVYETAY